MKENSNAVYGWKKWIIVLALALVAGGTVRLSESWRDEKSRMTDGSAAADTIVIDAGHGGFDGGAVGGEGTCEKEINLSIALQLAQLAERDGWNVIMTRRSDLSLDQGMDEKMTIRTRKTEDLRARKEIIDETKPCLAVSIHLNSFQEDPSVRGAQTFYPSRAAEEEIAKQSQRLAENVQEALVLGLADGTNRKAMGKTDVLLLKDPKVPTILVECGFVSNAEELNLLKTQEYQVKLSEFIYNGIMEFSGKTRRENLFVLDSCSP